ncbi:MAG: hypothetical protein V3S01_03760 [Dehalococcoidia bacterium]
MTVRIVSDRREVLSHFDAEYGKVAVSQADRPQIDVHAGPYDTIVTEAPDLCEYRGRHKTIRWRLAVSGLDSDVTRLAFDGRGSMAISFLQTFYLEPLLRHRMLDAGAAMVHGCTVVQNGKSTLFAGGTGVGKTTLALAQATNGGVVLGDNWVVVTPDGMTLTFPRRIRLYGDLRRANPEAYRRLPPAARRRLTTVGIISRLSFGYANLPVRLAREEVAPNSPPVSDVFPLGSAFVLLPDKGSELAEPRPLSLEELLTSIQAVNHEEGERLAAAVEPYLTAHPDSRFHTIAERERAILTGAFEGLPAFELMVPRVSNPSALASRILSLSRTV